MDDSATHKSCRYQDQQGRMVIQSRPVLGRQSTPWRLPGRPRRGLWGWTWGTDPISDDPEQPRNRTCASQGHDATPLTMIGLSQCLAISRTISSLNERECVDVPMSTVGLTSLTTVWVSATAHGSYTPDPSSTQCKAHRRGAHTHPGTPGAHIKLARRRALTEQTLVSAPPHSPSMSHNASCSGFSLSQSLTSSSGLAYASCA